MANETGKTKNGSGIRKGVDLRRRSGEPRRDIHGKGSDFGASLPPADLSFDMPSEPEPIAQPDAQARSDEDRRTSGSGKAGSASARSAAADSERTQKTKKRRERDRLNTSAVAEARGISHEERRRKQSRRDLLKVLSVLVGILLVAAAGIMGYNSTLVKSVRISGSSVYGETQLLSMSGIAPGRSIFTYDEAELKSAMNSISEIRTLSVKKIFPDRIDIVVDDVSASAAIVSSTGTYTLIADDGYVLSIGDELPEGMIELRGMTGYGFSLNSRIDEQHRNIRTVGVLALLDAVRESAIAESVRFIDVSSSAYVMLGLDHGYTIVLGSISTAPECVPTAAEAYSRFLPIYENGGTIQVFSGSTVVDFTPAKP